MIPKRRVELGSARNAITIEDQTEDNDDDLYDLSDTPRRRQQPDQIEDEEKDRSQQEQRG